MVNAYLSLLFDEGQENLFVCFPVLENVSVWWEKTVQSNKVKEIGGQVKFLFTKVQCIQNHFVVCQVTSVGHSISQFD